MIVWRSQTLDVLRLGIFAKISTQMKTRLLPFALVTVVDAEKWKSIKKKMRACYGTKTLELKLDYFISVPTILAPKNSVQNIFAPKNWIPKMLAPNILVAKRYLHTT